MSPVIFYTTFPTLPQAEEISQKLLEQKLIACANLVPHGKAMYIWEGKLESTAEIFAFWKSSTRNFQAVEDYLKKHHPYKVFCLEEWKVGEVSAPYREWLEASLNSPK